MRNFTVKSFETEQVNC